MNQEMPANSNQVASTPRSTSSSSKVLWAVIVLVLLLVAAGLGYLFGNSTSKPTTTPTPNTTDTNTTNTSNNQNTDTTTPSTPTTTTETKSYDWSGGVGADHTTALTYTRESGATVKTSVQETGNDTGITISNNDYDLEIFNSMDGSQTQFQTVPASKSVSTSNATGGSVTRVQTETPNVYFYTSKLNVGAECSIFNPDPAACAFNMIDFDNGNVSVVCKVKGNTSNALTQCDAIVSSLGTVITNR